MPAEPQKPKSVFAEADSMSTDELAARVRDLENALAATRAGLPLSLLPEHSAGDGTTVAETWSQAEQEQATAVAQGWPGHPSTQMSGPPGKP